MVLTRKQLTRVVVFWLVAAPMLVGVLVLNEVNQSSYRAAKELVSSDQGVRALVGPVQSVRLDLLAGFDRRFDGSRNVARYVLKVDGLDGQGVAELTVSGRSGFWLLRAGTFTTETGQSIAIEPRSISLGDSSGP